MEKLRKYCAYQERSHRDVTGKLWDMKVPPDWHDDILIALIQDNFINEERFARTYARGKFTMKKWGRLKIVQGLKRHGVSAVNIRTALTEIDEDHYMDVLRETIDLKRSKLKEKNPWKRKAAIMRFAAQRGFEHGLITELLNN